MAMFRGQINVIELIKPIALIIQSFPIGWQALPLPLLLHTHPVSLCLRLSFSDILSSAKFTVVKCVWVCMRLCVCIKAPSSLKPVTAAPAQEDVFENVPVTGTYQPVSSSSSSSSCPVENREGWKLWHQILHSASTEMQDLQIEEL